MPHFLAMMVRAPRAVDLVANSELAICSRVLEAGRPAVQPFLAPCQCSGRLGAAEPVNSPPDQPRAGRAPSWRGNEASDRYSG